MSKTQLNVLLTSVGRRVELLKIFKESLCDRGKVFAADCDRTAPGLYFADKSFVIPKVSSKKYIHSLLEICRNEKITLLVPLIDPELIKIAKNRNKLINIGVIPLLSTYRAVSIAYDKYLTWQFFEKNNIPTPRTWLVDNFRDINKASFPLILKPRFGSASIGIHKCDDINDLKYFINKIKPAVIQEYLSGEEVTIDVLCDFKGNFLCAVQRKRIKVRAGEVERGVTIKNEEISNLVKIIIDKLKPIGVINIQCFITDKGILFTEINPRFGGGYPLSYQAGVNFPQIIFDLIEGKDMSYLKTYDYKTGCYMLRYDNAIYLVENELESKSFLIR